MKSGERVKQATNNWRALFCYRSIWKSACNHGNWKATFTALLPTNIEEHLTALFSFKQYWLLSLLCPTDTFSDPRLLPSQGQSAREPASLHSSLLSSGLACSIPFFSLFTLFSVITLKSDKVVQLTHMGQEYNSWFNEEALSSRSAINIVIIKGQMMHWDVHAHLLLITVSKHSAVLWNKHLGIKATKIQCFLFFCP